MSLFQRNALITGVIISLPSIFRFTGMVASILGCLLSILAILYFYKSYADTETDKSILTPGKGLKFGLLVGVVVTIISFIILVMFVDDIRKASIEVLENMRETIGDEITDNEISKQESLTNREFILKSLIFYPVVILIDGLFGLIAGAIFKQKKEA